MPSSTRISTFAALVYIPLACVAVLWSRYGQHRNAWEFDPAWMDASYGVRLVVSLLSGLALGVLVVGLTPVLVERTKWAQALERELRPVVADASPRDVTWLAISSGLAEELFFRGAVQPVVGLWVTSLIFGAVHVGPKRVFIAWGVWAFLMGLILGAIFEWTGVLWGSVLGHVWINQRNLRYIQRH